MSAGLTVSVESEIGGFFWSLTVCGRCTLLSAFSFFFDALLASSFGILSGGIVGVRVLQVVLGKHVASSGELRGVEPLGNRSFQLIDRTASPKTKAGGNGH